jgi:hypothetical protein
MSAYRQKFEIVVPVESNARGPLSYGAGLLAALVFVVFVVIAASLGMTQEASIVVLVNDDPISDYDVEQRERFLAITTQEQPSPELKKKATDQLIDERLQVQQGRKLSVSVDEDDVTQIVEDMAKKNNLDVDGLATALGKAGVNIKTLKDRIRSQLVWQNVVRQKFRREIQIGDVDVDKALSDAWWAGERGPGGDGASAPSSEVRVTRRRRPEDDCRKACGGGKRTQQIRVLRRSCQGCRGRQCQNAGRPTARFASAARKATRDERQDGTDDAPYPHSIGGGDVRRVWQALGEGRRQDARGHAAETDERGDGDPCRSAAARSPSGRLHRIPLNAYSC